MDVDSGFLDFWIYLTSTTSIDFVADLTQRRPDTTDTTICNKLVITEQPLSIPKSNLTVIKVISVLLPTSFAWKRL